MVARGCGSGRTIGGIYLECGLSLFGMPIEHFLVDEPITIDVKSLGINPVGVKLIKKNETWHVFDWVGSKFYPNVADFIMETGYFGLSRKIARTIDFSKLTAESKIFLIHSRGYDCCFHKFTNLISCPKSLCKCESCQEIALKHNKSPLPCMCAATYWHNIEGGEEWDYVVTRKMPAFEYKGKRRPRDLVEEYKPAIFLKLPITNIAVINDPEGDSHKKSLQKANNSSLPVILKKE